MTLPNQLDPTQPPDTQDQSLGAQRMREHRQFLLDVLGLPASAPINNPLVAGDGTGLKHIFLQDNAADPTVDGEVVRSGSMIKYRLGGVTYRLPSGGVNARIYRAGVFTLGAGLNTIFPFDSVSWDANGMFTLGDSSLKAVIPGQYLIVCTLDLGSIGYAGLTGYVGAQIVQASQEITLVVNPVLQSEAVPRTLQLTAVALMGAGQKIQVTIINGTNQTFSFAGGTTRYWLSMNLVG